MLELPHTFRDAALLDLALTHASVGGSGNNERLEFLGDAVLDLVVAEELYGRCADVSEGRLTELKAEVVSRRSLARCARRLRLAEAARLGGGMRGRELPASVLAGLYEALLGAVYLDAGYGAAREFARETLAATLRRALQGAVAGNPKQRLQELSQASGGRPPEYRVLRQRGRAHTRAFLVHARVQARVDGAGTEGEGGEPTSFPGAWGRTLKEAERWAAHEALLVLEHRGPEGGCGRTSGGVG